VAFYDRSKNSSRTWCSMSSCGNRAKTRAYRGRRHAARHRVDQGDLSDIPGRRT
jgi:predicted RNA-binding Zn ribbon-like protein